MNDLVEAPRIGGEGRAARLSDATDLAADSAYLTANQALVRLLLAQAAADRTAGLSTAGFVSGYRGSPLGGIDQALWRAAPALDAAGIVFQPGLNEELAATAVWGSQQAGLWEKPRYDGVFGVWYGKGPGVDRAGDAIKHANLAGTAAHGGVLLLAGDDHAAKSSTTAHQSEQALIAAGVPVLNPASVEELIAFGLFGYAASRFSGLWVGMKCLTAVMDSATSWQGDRVQAFVTPTGVAMPADGLNIRGTDRALDQEERLHRWKLPAFTAMVRANGLDRVTHAAPAPRCVIVTTGKSWLDTVAALDALGFEEAGRAAAGIVIYKVACSWPLDSAPILDLARDCREVLVVEEKAGIIEDQLLAAWARIGGGDLRFSGKTDPGGAPLLKAWGELDSVAIASAVAARLTACGIAVPRTPDSHTVDANGPGLARPPFFCAGCPHNSSTRVPDGSLAGGGIGCHGLAVWNQADYTLPFTQMGGEGANWIGRAPFVESDHIFQNLGDGTYTHSGVLAVRAAVAARANITFKVLYNHAVAMTGGQPAEGALSAPAIAAQLVAEGITKLVVVTDNVAKFPPGTVWPAGVTVHHRDLLDTIQRSLRDIPGTTALLYDQSCATELRRLRKRGQAPKAATAVFINDLVCEGCGDCGAVSNCVAIQPIDTPLGRKRTIDAMLCNSDLSCLKGFCPSFVTVTGGTPSPENSAASASQTPPDPTLPTLDRVWNVVLTGVGGTGVVTQAALLGMAAHIDGKQVRVVDHTGMAQKNGGVTSQVMIAPAGDAVSAGIAAGQLDVLIANDVAVATTTAVMAQIGAHTACVANTALTAPGGFTRDRNLALDPAALVARLRAACASVTAADATARAVAAIGNAASANVMMLGMAWQRGLVPLSHAALVRAIELNGAAVARNLQAFEEGRGLAEAEAVDTPAAPSSLDDLIAAHADRLQAYQDRRYADLYRARMTEIRVAAARADGDRDAIVRTAADTLRQLMAYKDEYEVARLLTDPDRLAALRSAAGKTGRLHFHLSPPLLARLDPRTGRPRKMRFGGWILPAFRLLASARRLRGTPFDPFGYTAERKRERSFAADYVAMLTKALRAVGEGRHDTLVALAAAPREVRGYGPVKHAAYTRYEIDRDALLTQLSAPVAA